jgi:hypothetical protein
MDRGPLCNLGGNSLSPGIHRFKGSRSSSSKGISTACSKSRFLSNTQLQAWLKEPDTDFTPTVQGYTLLYKIGQGANSELFWESSLSLPLYFMVSLRSGSVYVGVQKEYRRLVAVKICRSVKGADQGIDRRLDLLEWESIWYTKLDGVPGVSNIFHVGLSGEFRFLVMEYLGPSLASLRKNHTSRLTIESVSIIAEQTVSGAFWNAVLYNYLTRSHS